MHHGGGARVRRGESAVEQPQRAAHEPAALCEVEEQRVRAEEQRELSGDGHRQEGAVVALADAAADDGAVVVHHAHHAAAHRAEAAARRPEQLRTVAEALGQRRSGWQPAGGGEGLGPAGGGEGLGLQAEGRASAGAKVGVGECGERSDSVKGFRGATFLKSV